MTHFVGEELLCGLQESHVALDWGFVHFNQLSDCVNIQNGSVTVLWSSGVLSRLAEKSTYTCALIVAARFGVTPPRLLIISLNFLGGVCRWYCCFSLHFYLLQAGLVHQFLAANRMFFGQTDHLVQKFQSQRSTCARPAEFTPQFPSKLCWFLPNIELLCEREEPVFHLFIASWEQHLCLTH